MSNNYSDMTIVVLEGGLSKEREVSLESGEQVKKVLKEIGYHVVSVDMQPNLISQLEKIKPDVVFNALHGKYGEDGCVPGALDIAGIPYTHSGVLASALAMNKTMAKKIFTLLGIQSPKGGEYTAEALTSLVDEGKDVSLRPYVLKPREEGSSVGVHIIERDNKNVQNILNEWQHDNVIMLEEYIAGKELTVSVLDGKALEVTELITTDTFYDYEAKYTDGVTTHVIPAHISDEVTQEVCRIAEEVHKEFGCRIVSRCDFRYDDSKLGVEGLYLLEVNTHPGLTPLSLLPEAAAKSGISFKQLIKKMIDEALSH